MKMRLILIALVVGLVLVPASALAAGIGVSPDKIELELPSNGSTQVPFYLTSFDFDGEVEIGLQDIPLRIEPTKVDLSSEEAGKEVVVTFYGNKDLGKQTFNGFVTFRGLVGGNIAVQLNVRANITQTGAVQALPGEEPPEQTSPPQAGTEGLPLATIVAVCLGLVFVGLIALVIGLVRRRGY